MPPSDRVPIYRAFVRGVVMGVLVGKTQDCRARSGIVFNFLGIGQVAVDRVNRPVCDLDRTGDGVPDALAVGKASSGALSTVMLIDAATGRQVTEFNAFQPAFLGGVAN